MKVNINMIYHTFTKLIKNIYSKNIASLKITFSFDYTNPIFLKCSTSIKMII